MDKNQEIFHSTVIRTVLKKMLKSEKVDEVIPIQLDSLRSKFVEEAKKLHFNFSSENTMDLCQEVFVMSFFVSLASDYITDREIEGIFTIVAQAMDIHHSQRGYAYFWFHRGCKIADEERRNFSILGELSQDICKTLRISNPAPLPTIEQMDNLFKSLDRSIFEDIDVDEQLTESVLAQIAFQSGYISALNLGDVGSDRLNEIFTTVFKSKFCEDQSCSVFTAVFESPFGNQTYETMKHQQSSDEILTYFLLFKEGFKKALARIGWGFFWFDDGNYCNQNLSLKYLTSSSYFSCSAYHANFRE